MTWMAENPHGWTSLDVPMTYFIQERPYVIVLQSQQDIQWLKSDPQHQIEDSNILLS